MQVTIRCVGQKGPKWLQQEIEDYNKRLTKPFALKIEIVPHSLNRNKEQQKLEEGKKLLKDLPNSSLLIAMQIEGKNYSTHQLANIIKEKSSQFRKAIIFIGGCHGLSAEVSDMCDLSWSLSSLTLTHGHVRLIIAEQWYRINCIQQQHPYHK